MCFYDCSQYTDGDAESQNFLPNYLGKKKYEAEYVSVSSH